MTKRGLGKGLSALLSATEGDQEAQNVRQIPVDRLRSNPYQPRRHFDENALKELADSIRENGVLQPVLVRRVGPEDYELIVGERRLRACRMAGLATIPAIVRECSDRDMLLMALIENVQRHDVNAVEQALAYARMQEEFGFTHEEIARRVGKSRVAVSNTLRLLTLSPDVLKALEAGQISEGHARLLVGMTPDSQRALLEAFLGHDMTVRQAEAMVREMRRGEQGAAATTAAKPLERDPNHQALEDALSQALGTRVAVEYYEMGRGRIRIEFYSDEQLEGLVDRLLGPAA